MNNAKYIVTWICLLWLTIGSCVDKFNAHLPESSTRVLIVEGNIISDSTVVFFWGGWVALYFVWFTEVF